MQKTGNEQVCFLASERDMEMFDAAAAEHGLSREGFLRICVIQKIVEYYREKELRIASKH